MKLEEDKYDFISNHISRACDMFHYPLSAKNKEEIFLTLQMSSIVDDLFDSTESHQEKERIVQELSLLLDGRSNDIGGDYNALLCQRASIVREKGKQDTMKILLKKIMNCNTILHKTSSTKTFVKQRYKEGVLSGKVLLELFDNIPHRLETIGISSVATLNLLDSFIDANMDYKLGDTNVKPSLSHKWALLIAGIKTFRRIGFSAEEKKTLLAPIQKESLIKSTLRKFLIRFA